MDLPVLNDSAARGAGADDPWYADGLKFTCTQCGNCCTGGPGFVWISEEEIGRLAAYLKVTPEEIVTRYCRRIGSRYSLKERKTPQGLFDCVFLVEQPAKACGGELAPGADVPLARKGCSVYPVRPLQCRTWPFWPENLESPEEWRRASRKCHGMGNGHRHFVLERIEALRDAEDWPENPPTSAPPGDANGKR